MSFLRNLLVGCKNRNHSDLLEKDANKKRVFANETTRSKIKNDYGT